MAAGSRPDCKNEADSLCGLSKGVCVMQVKNSMFEYGRHLGLAFQVVDDILDFTTRAELLGKPQVGHWDMCS